MAASAQAARAQTNLAGVTPGWRTAIGVLNLVEGVVALVAVVGAYGLAERLVVAQEATADQGLAVEPAWWGIEITLGMSLILVGTAGAFAGGVARQSMAFASRSGYETLERSFTWWYVLNPVWSALLGGAFVTAANAGLVSIGDDTTSTAALPMLATMGALAGLFTDQVLQRMRSVIGLTDPKVAASQVPEPATIQP